MKNCSEELEKLVIAIAQGFKDNHISCNMIVGAEYGKTICCRKCISILKDELEKDLHPKILQKLNALGGVGTVRYGNTLGYCAEVHAASGLLKQKDTQDIEIDQIKFSNAYRPRNMFPTPTSGIKDYCQNCIDTFNIKN